MDFFSSLSLFPPHDSRRLVELRQQDALFLPHFLFKKILQLPVMPPGHYADVLLPEVHCLLDVLERLVKVVVDYLDIGVDAHVVERRIGLEVIGPLTERLLETKGRWL